MGHVLAEGDHRRVAEAIRRAEMLTSGEIFVVVARESGDYRILPLVWAGLTALAAGFVTAALFPEMSAASLALGQLIVLIALAALLWIPTLRVRLVPAGLQQAAARRRAMEQFLAHNLHVTATRTGVLIYVSLAERHASVIADAAIHSRVPDGFWDGIIRSLTVEIAAGRLADGLVHAVEACGGALADNFPREPGDRNELPDKVVEV